MHYIPPPPSLEQRSRAHVPVYTHPLSCLVPPLTFRSSSRTSLNSTSTASPISRILSEQCCTYILTDAHTNRFSQWDVCENDASSLRALYFRQSASLKITTRIPSSHRVDTITFRCGNLRSAPCLLPDFVIQNGMKYNQVAWNRERAEIKSDFESCEVGDGGLSKSWNRVTCSILSVYGHEGRSRRLDWPHRGR